MKWNSINGIFIKHEIINMLDEGKSRDDIINLFYDASNNGNFLWGTSSRESIEQVVDEVIEMNKPRKRSFYWW